MNQELPTCKFCGTKLVDRGHFKNRKAYDYYRRFKKCQKCQDYDSQDWRKARPLRKSRRR